MIKNCFIQALTLFVLTTTAGIALGQNNPPSLTWQQLAQVQFEEVYSEETGSFYDKPVFPYSLKIFEGKEVMIKGYLIPMDVDLNQYVISATPFSSCFFCGAAGPETVVELNLADKSLSFKTDEYLNFCGKLRLNTGTFFQLPYILNEARPCGN